SSVITFGFDQKNDYAAKNIRFNKLGHASFDLIKHGKKIIQVDLSVPGKHNCLNALAALATAEFHGIDLPLAVNNIKEFRGTDRRFQYKGYINGAAVIHDYAHHPTEVKATLATLDVISHNKVWCVFQPHTYSRTKTLFNDFVNAFDNVSELFLTDIYAAREKKDDSINSQMLARALEEKGVRVTYEPSIDIIAQTIRANAREGDVIMTLGAGNIEKINDLILCK
ncbi:MAG TPA: cyanophycin synthetase, partial [Clostridia bacterium]|nr:cyanophycin synthetase [Clostridia bacterium]